MCWGRGLHLHLCAPCGSHAKSPRALSDGATEGDACLAVNLLTLCSWTYDISGQRFWLLLMPKKREKETL